MKVLVVGSGAREHCLVWKLVQSPLVEKVYCAPGNGGTFSLAENVDISPQDISSLVKFALREKVDFTVVGPEAPLVEGIVDEFEQVGLKIFGPRKEVAMLEGSKGFAKKKMREYGIPTADFEIFDAPKKAKEYVRKKKVPIVIKADGLAAGKGVVVAKSIKEAEEAIEFIMVKKKFGKAGEKIVIEDFLEGEEVSVLMFTDTETAVPLVSSQDYKRAFDGDEGPNTGGMGAYSPVPFISEEVFRRIKEEVFVRLIKGLNKEGKVYKGVIYAGLMIKDNKPYVLEFNVRFGDPETQVILPKLNTDLAEVIMKTIEGRLSEVVLDWDDRFCLCVVLASGGYPGKYETGKEIKGLKAVTHWRDLFVFHAGTKIDIRSPSFRYLTEGGRVLNIVGIANTAVKARDMVYEAIKHIHFEGMFYRKDIGEKAIKCFRKKNVEISRKRG